jgi:hypothetical protein
MEDGSDHPSEEMTLDDGLPTRTIRSSSLSSGSSGRRRNLSGTLLSKLPFLRVSQMTEVGSDKDPTGRQGEHGAGPSGTWGGRAMASALQQQRKMRRRRGSLRKTALLGTRIESKEKRGAFTRSQDVPSVDMHGYNITDNLSQRTPPSPTTSEDKLPPQGNVNQNARISSPYWVPRATKPHLNLPPSHHQPEPTSISPNDETTTDDEYGVSLPRLGGPANRNSSAAGSTAANVHIPTPSSSSDSYFPPQSDTLPRPIRSAHRAKSPLATHPVEISSQEEWDYSETEWWGWIILIVTWLVFVIGMGSCFGVWSWAWDVGETPYAPPELEDDPTLPIVGYYPALMVLTAVMAWVWVVVAWVGMKYFKHANISGDDG